MATAEAMGLNSCFNPRPPRRAGATTGRTLAGSINPVSILARPEERALRIAEDPPRSDFTVSILARPEERALLMLPARLITLFWFQSSPAPKSGRYSA